MLIVKVPAINGLGKTKGCENAPVRILAELQEIYTNERGTEIKINKQQVKEIAVNLENIEETTKNILNQAKKIFSSNEFAVFLGGDHSITYPLLKAFSETHANAGIIIFDAHADCVNRIKEPTHEDWLRTTIENGFKAGNVILVGLRNLHTIEREFMQKNKIKCFMQKELENLQDTCDAIMETARKFDALYLSIDIDAVDPAFAPATGYLEPAGLSSREIIYFMQRLSMLKNLKAADIVEVNPSKGINNITSRLAAKIISELAK
jgi:agmatinase